MHLWLDGALGFPIKRPTAGGVPEKIGELSIRAQFGVYGAINGSPRIGEFLNNLMGCDGADVGGLNDEFALESVLVQLFANARIEVTLDLEKLLNLSPGTQMEIGADAAFMFEFTKRPGEDTFEAVMFDVWRCSDLGELLGENEWVAAQLSKTVYQKEDDTPADHSYLVTDCGADRSLSIFRLDKISPIAGFNCEIHYVQELNTIVVAFRGMDEIGDWLTNFDFNTRQCSLAYPCGKIHSGFQSETHRTASHVLTALQRIVASSSNSAAVKIGITGHSLGGALAQGFAMWLCGNDGGDPALCASIDWVITFGAPMICGDQGCESKYESLLGSRTKRFVNACGPDPDPKHDPVVPNPPGYVGPGLPIQLPSPGVTPSLDDNKLCHSMSVYVDAAQANSLSPSNRCRVSPASPSFPIGDIITPAMETPSPRSSAVPNFSAGSCSVAAVPDSHGALAFLENTFNRILNPESNAHVDIRASLAITTDDLLPILEGKLGKFGKFLGDVLDSVGASLASKMMLRLALPGPQVHFGFTLDVGLNLNIRCREIQLIVDTITGIVNFIKGFFQTLQDFISAIQDILDLIAGDPDDDRNQHLGQLNTVITTMRNVLGDCNSNPKTGLCGLIETIDDAMDDALAGVIGFTNAVCGDGVGMGVGVGFAFLDGSVKPQDTYVAAWLNDDYYKLSLDMLPECGASDASKAVGEKCLSNDDCVTGNCNLLDFSLHIPGDALCFGTCHAKLGQWGLCTSDSQCQDGLGCCGGICVKQEDDGHFCLLDCACKSGACTRATCGTLGPGKPCWPGFDHHCTGHENGNTCCGLGLASACGGQPDGFTTCFMHCACESGLCIQGECCSTSQCGHDDACGDDEYCEIVLAQGCGSCKPKKEGGAACTDLTPIVGQSTDQCLSGRCDFGFCTPKNRGQACNDDNMCQSGHCCGIIGDSGFCQDCCAGDHSHCEPDGWCHALDQRCKPKSEDGTLCVGDVECETDNCDWFICGGRCPIGDHSVCKEVDENGNVVRDGWCHAATGKCKDKNPPGTSCVTWVECQSGVCGGVIAGCCASNECASNSDCNSETEYCNAGALSPCGTCVSKSGGGGSCDITRLGTDCISGTCDVGYCTPKSNGQACGFNVDSVCASGNCCGATGIGAGVCGQCDADSDCGSGSYCSDCTCKPKKSGGSGCGGGNQCISGTCDVGYCTPKSNGQACGFNVDSVCASGNCCGATGMGAGVCGECDEDSDCGSGSYCDGCTCKPKKSNGDTGCSGDEECLSNICNLAGTCVECGDNGDCPSSKPVCIWNKCEPLQPDGYTICAGDHECQNKCCGLACRQCCSSSDCSSSQYCSGNKCVAKKSNGSGCSSSSQCSSGYCWAPPAGICSNSGCKGDTVSCTSTSQCCGNLECRSKLFGGKHCSWI